MRRNGAALSHTECSSFGGHLVIGKSDNYDADKAKERTVHCRAKVERVTI
jgi:hypothetical protein